MLKRLIYPAVLTQDSDGISISFPDLEGCFSSADTFNDAYDYAKEAMELFLEDYVYDYFKSAPIPSRLQDIPLESNQCIALIEINVKEYLRTLDNTAVKKTLTIPSWLNKAAMDNDINFSQVLKEALIEKIKEI